MSLFIVLDGCDGVGKTTLSRALADAIRERTGEDEVILTREPTDTGYGAELREAFRDGVKLGFERELSLFMQDRKCHVEGTILRGLEDLMTVITDRYYFSTAAYQSTSLFPKKDQTVIRNKVASLILTLCESFFPSPDLYLYLDSKNYHSRLRNRGINRTAWEKDLEFQEGVRSAFEHVYHRYKGNKACITTDGPKEVTLAKAMHVYDKLVGL